MRLEEIHSGKMWFSSRATVTPVRRDLCRIDFVAAWNLPFLPMFLFGCLGRLFAAGSGDDDSAGGRVEA